MCLLVCLEDGLSLPVFLVYANSCVCIKAPSVAVDIEYLLSDLMVRQLGDEQELQSTRITDVCVLMFSYCMCCLTHSLTLTHIHSQLHRHILQEGIEQKQLMLTQQKSMQILFRDRWLGLQCHSPQV